MTTPLPSAQVTLEEHVWALAYRDKPVQVSDARAVVTELRALLESETTKAFKAGFAAVHASAD